MDSEDLFEDFTEEAALSHLNGQDEADDVVQNVKDQTEPENSGKEADSEVTDTADLLPNAGDTSKDKLVQLSLSRIRSIMKLDPDMNIASNEAVFLVTRATEEFISSLARESYFYTAQAKKKTVQKRDIELAIAAIDSLLFLDGAMF